jgi:general secretion pathway protein D
MKNVGTLFCAVALASALPTLLRAQNAPVPVNTPQGAAAFTALTTTGAVASVVLVVSNATGPIYSPLTAGGPAPITMTVSAPAISPGTAAPAAALAPVTTLAPAAPAPIPVVARFPGAPVPAGVPPILLGGGAAATNTDNGVQLNFRDAPLDQLLNMYGDLTGRTVIKGPLINAIITVRSQNTLTVPEAIQALESVLQLNGIALVQMGAKFVKVTKSELGRMESLALKRGGKGNGPAETDQLASYIFTLKYIETDEVVSALQNVLHTYGKIQVLERANSVMLTDTSANLQRAQEILEFMDVPPEARVETKIYELENGDAASIAMQLQSIVDDAQGKATAQRPRPGVTPVPVPVVTPQGAVRAPAVGGADTALEDGLIQGKVKILADDRTNMLIIIARPSNFPFFERLIKELDRKVEPEVVVRVIQLHWAEADQIAGLLNDMLGSSGGTYGSRGQTTGGTTGSAFGGGAAGATGARTGSTLSSARRTGRSTANSRSRTTATAARPVAAPGAAGTLNPFGNNAPNVTTTTRVLGDLRSNSLLMMGTKEDIADLEKVIEKLDIMLSQVLIEAVILEVDLSKTTEAGITWLQRSLQAYNQSAAGPGGGAQIRQPVAAFGGGFNPSTSSATIPNGASVANGFVLPGGGTMPGGLNYYTTISGLNLDTIIRLVNSTSDARILSTPVIMATDNEVAEIKNTKQKPVITSTTIYATGQGATSSSYEYKDIGIDLVVKPHINPNRMVVLDITQTADSEAGSVSIDGNDVPIINKREIQGLITVEDRTTIVLGGLVETTSLKGRSSIPILGDIPLIGWLFRNDKVGSARTELLVLITPYVLKTPEEARAETKRLQQNSEMKDVFTRGWSDSSLAKPDPEIERASRKRTIFGKGQAPVAPAEATVTNAAPAAVK